MAIKNFFKKNIFKNKKAIYFSMISLLILLVLIASSKQSPYVVDSQTQKFYEKRILLTTNQIDAFRKGFLEKSLEFSSYSSLKGIAEYRIRLGKNYLSKKELEDDLKNSILFGNVTVCLKVGSGLNCFQDPLSKVSGYKYDFGLVNLLDEYSKMIYDAYKIKFEFPKNFNDYKIKVYQDKTTGPFFVGVNLTFSYNVSAGKDSYGNDIAVWNITETIPIKVSIEGIKDPYMSITSGRNYNYTYKKFFSEKWNTQVFKKFVDSQGYIYNNKSLSFLGRFYNSEEYNDCCGIMTTINKTKYDLYHCGAIGEITNRSFVDCEYFDYTQTGITCRDKEDNIVYNITGISNDNFPFTITAEKAKDFNISNSDLNYIPIEEYSQSSCPIITLTAECGNNICEEGEPVEGNSNYCPQDCPNYNAECGNGIVESDYGEICDINDPSTATVSCTTKDNYPGTKSCISCTSYSICETTLYCGDGIFTSQAEECEYTDGISDGYPDLDCNAPYANSCQYCDSSCKIQTNYSIETCGDGIIQNPPEKCDGDTITCTTTDGYSGTQTCKSDCSGYNTCTSSEFCGDGVINGNEQCDEGSNNGVVCNAPYGGSCQYCDSSCKIQTKIGPYCGDGIKQSNEACEYTDGISDGYPDLDCNAPYGGSCQYCDSSCTIRTKTGPYCGDGIINGNEVCDKNSRSCTVDPDKYYDGGYPGTQTCKSDCSGYNTCTSPYYCGDAIKNGNEQCDYNDPNDGLPICSWNVGTCCSKTYPCDKYYCGFFGCSNI